MYMQNKLTDIGKLAVTKGERERIREVREMELRHTNYYV